MDAVRQSTSYRERPSVTVHRRHGGGVDEVIGVHEVADPRIVTNSASDTSSTSASSMGDNLQKVPLHDAPRLQNIGNSCFVNATLQALYHASPFKRALENSSCVGNACVNEPCLANVIRQFFATMSMREQCIIDTSSIYSRLLTALSYTSSEIARHDQEEFLTLLLTKLHDSPCLQDVPLLFTTTVRETLACGRHESTQVSVETIWRHAFGASSSIVQCFGTALSEKKHLEYNPRGDANKWETLQEEVDAFIKLQRASADAIHWETNIYRVEGHDLEATDKQ